MGLTITAWNVKQGGGPRASRLVEALLAVDTDIALLSEWRATAANRLAEQLDEAGFQNQIRRPDPLGGYAAMLVAARVPIRPTGIDYDDPDDGHRFCHVDITESSWSVAHAYVPGYEQCNDRKRRFWSFITDVWAPQIAHRNVLLCGDLNTGLHYRDELGATFKSDDQHAALEEAGWRDAWIERNRQRRPPATWFSPNGGGPFRLDHALLSPTSLRAKGVEYPATIRDVNVLGPNGLSDHLPIVVQLP